MGKKKDKASKSKKKKSAAGPVLQAETDRARPAETEPALESKPDTETGAHPCVEYVSAQDVMELVNSLSQDLEQLDKSNQALQQQITQSQNQNQPLWLYTILITITLVLGTAIAAGGYYGTTVSTGMEENMAAIANRIDNIKARVESMNTSMSSISSDMTRLNTTFENLSAKLASIENDINKAASNTATPNTGAASTPYDPYRMGYPRSAWR